MQLSFNLVVLFARRASLLMIRRYRLDPREALALRPAQPAVWLAVLVGAPAGLLTGIGFFRLASLVFPVPPKMLEAFSKALLPDRSRSGRRCSSCAVMPGIFEEMAFRGVLLHGLVRRFHPGGVRSPRRRDFGLFHVSLFRLVPTGYLGVLLAAVTMLTGSIFPAMLWHSLNNLIGVVSPALDIPWGSSGPEVYGAATAGLVLCRLDPVEAPDAVPGLRWRRRRA